MNNIPYTYLIGWSDQQLWYYGCQYGSNANPDNLWKTYFTSSRVVKELRTTIGEPDVIQVRRTFSSNTSALIWESKVLSRLDAANDAKWLNQHNSNGKFNVLTSQRWTTEQSRIDQAKVMREQRQDPIFKQKWFLANKWKSSDRELYVIENRDRLIRPEHKKAMREGYDKFWSDPLNRKLHSERQKERNRLNREKKPVLADGVLYKSIHDCAEHYCRSIKWVRSQINKGNFEIKPVE